MTRAEAEAEVTRIKGLGRKLQARVRLNCAALSSDKYLVEVKDPRPKSGTVVSAQSKNTAVHPTGLASYAYGDFVGLRLRGLIRGGTTAAGATAGRFSGHTGWLTYTIDARAQGNVPNSDVTAFPT